MQKEYLVVSSWVDKKTGSPFSSLAEIKRGISKDGGRPYEMLSDNREIVDGTYSVGTILSGSLSLTVTTHGEAEPQRALKLGTAK